MAPEVARKLGIRQAILAMPGIGRQQLVTVFERLGASFTRLIIVPDMFGMASLWVTARDLGGVLGASIAELPMPPLQIWTRMQIRTREAELKSSTP